MKKLLLLLCVFAALHSSAQKKTLYQLQKNALTTRFLKDLGVPVSTIKQYANAGEVGALFLLGDIGQRLQTQRGALLLLQYNADLKKAEKLKTAEDFKRDANELAAKKKKEAEEAAIWREKQEAREREEAIALAEREKKEAAEMKEAEERERQEEAESQARLAAETQKRIYHSSDDAVIKGLVREELSQWLTKGEFEKTSDWETRVRQNLDSAFQNICYRKFDSWMEQFIPTMSLKLGKYDADREVFPFTFSRGIVQTYTRHLGGETVSTTGEVHVGNGVAQDFKNAFDHEKLVLNKYTVKWRFVENNLFPTDFIYTFSGQPYKFQIASFEDNATIAYSDINLDGKPEGNSVFSFNVQGIQENERREKIAKAAKEAEKIEAQKSERKKKNAEATQKAIQVGGALGGAVLQGILKK